MKSVGNEKANSLLEAHTTDANKIDMHADVSVILLAYCSFAKHGLILIIFGQQHQHTFKKNIHVQLSFSLQFYLLYLILVAASLRRFAMQQQSTAPGPSLVTLCSHKSG